MNKLKSRVTEINATRRQRLVQNRIKEISNITEVSPITQKFFIARYNRKCRNKLCSEMQIKDKVSSNVLEISSHLKEVYGFFLTMIATISKVALKISFKVGLF